MLYVYRELSLYGPRRLKRIAKFIQNRSGNNDLRNAHREMFGHNSFRLEFTVMTSKPCLVSKITLSGAFEFVALKFDLNWDTLIRRMVRDKTVLDALCGLFGLETEGNTMRLFQVVSNKLSSVFMFPGDSSDTTTRKKYNDARLNLYTGASVFGIDLDTAVRAMSNFSETITNPLMRRMFWSSYIPGTGKFSVSIDNLDKLTNESELCPICLDDFPPENEGLKLEPCGHAIHFGCIRGFFLSSTVNRVTCPLCRGDIMNLVSRTGPSSPKSIDKVSEDKG